MKAKFEEFLHKLTNDSALIESLLTGYDAILESDYHKNRIEDGERIINTILNGNLYNQYVGDSKLGFLFKYDDFYLALDKENKDRIGEYKNIQGKDVIFLHILDSYLEQWMNKLAQDWSGKEIDVERVDRLVKQVVNNNKSLIVHEWNHKMDNDAGYLYDQSGKNIRRPSETKINDKLDELLSLRNDVTINDAKNVLNAVNSDVEFNAVITAAMADAIRNGKTGSFEEFLQAVKDNKQIKSKSDFANKTLFIDKLYKKLLKKVYIHYNSLNESADITDDNFKKWFNGSKVVDSSGNPLILYHGSQSRFNKFYGMWNARFEEERGTTYFTDDKDIATGYGSIVYECYLKMLNPLIYDAKGKHWTTVNFNALSQAKSNGHDGIILKNVHDTPAGKEDRPITTYIVYDSHQIKSATNNNGEYDPNSPNIFE